MADKRKSSIRLATKTKQNSESDEPNDEYSSDDFSPVRTRPSINKKKPTEDMEELKDASRSRRGSRRRTGQTRAGRSRSRRSHRRSSKSSRSQRRRR